MIKLKKTLSMIIAVGFLSNCSQVLETIELQVNNEVDAKQEKFNVIKKTLTIKEARKQSRSEYKRYVSQTGKGEGAKSIPESLAIKSEFPKNTKAIEYRIGIADTLSFSSLSDNNLDLSVEKNDWPTNINNFNYKLGVGDFLALTLLKDPVSLQSTQSTDLGDGQQITFDRQDQSETTINSTGRIGSDGSVLLLEVGRLEASGKTLNELQSDVRNILIRNGVSPRFQLEILQFLSQKAYLTINETSKVIFLQDQKTTLRDLLTSSGVGFRSGAITRVTLQRDKKDFRMSLRSIFSVKAPEIRITNQDHIFVEDSSSNLIKNVSTVDHDGTVVFAGVGKIKAVGLSLKELQNEISALMSKNPDFENEFQVKLETPASQKAIVSIPRKPGGVILISEIAISLEQVLTDNGVSVEGNNIIRINLRRNDKEYNFTLDKLLKLSPNNKIFLQPNDQVKIEALTYKENKVFLLGGIAPQIFKIKPSIRETLADILFAEGGPLSALGAKRSEVYLLRGSNPVVAYHLDAQNPTRLIVADAMELRPNDILYVAEQPIVSFNRTLATIVPLRILIKDIQENNIP